MFTLSREAIGLAVAEAQAINESYHTIHCPQCRHAIKLQTSEMRQQLPADYVFPELTSAAEPAPAGAAPPAAEEEPPKQSIVRKTAPRTRPPKLKAKPHPAKAKK